MRLPRVRLTVRLMMALVAMVALVLGGVRAREHYVRCMKIAASHRTNPALEKRTQDQHQWWIAYHSDSAQMFRRFAERERESARARARGPVRLKLFERLMPSAEKYTEDATPHEAEAERARKDLSLARASSEYERQMKAKYERAAYRPWERIAPDPPPPEPKAASSFWFNGREYARALAACREAMQSDPTDDWPFNQEAWILATCPDPKLRDGKKAIESATRACDLTKWANPGCLDTLAAAYADVWDFDKAIEWQRKAIELTAPGDPDRNEFLTRLELYQARKPYRDEPKGP